MWVLQAAVFWKGMEAIRRFIDFCGPAVNVVMFLLAGYLVIEAGWSNIDLNLSEDLLSGWGVVPVMLGAIALVVSYFSGPMLNYGDFARYGRTFKDVKKGNFLGLPLNFIVFALLVVITATLPVFGQMIDDPVETVARLDNTFAVILGALTFMIATIGINIVANFVSPAFDFSNVNPQKISWRMGGMIAAAGSVLITPWNLYSSPEFIHYTLDTLGAFIGPLYGVLIAHYYLIKKRRIDVDSMYTLKPEGKYYSTKGYNPIAIGVTAVGAVAAMAVVLFGSSDAAAYSWFIGAGIAFVRHWALSRKQIGEAVPEQVVASPQS
jgi:NCS1 family nucleobase:cation symporter-1